MPWRGIGLTDQGRVRQSNQDALAVLNEHAVWIVADGMGGRAGGDVASRLAVETLTRVLIGRDASDHFPHAAERGQAAVLRRAVSLSNEAILDEARRRPPLAGMGTTVVIAAINEAASEMTLVHVGDSRAYLLRGRALTRLTRDHSLVEEAVRQGELTEHEALEHPLRHVLTRALGTEADVAPEIRTSELQHDDLVLLCTDGLTKMLSDEDILATLARTRESPERACAALITEANRRGGDDNISVVIVRNELTNEGGGL